MLRIRVSRNDSDAAGRPSLVAAMQAALLLADEGQLEEIARVLHQLGLLSQDPKVEAERLDFTTGEVGQGSGDFA